MVRRLVPGSHFNKGWELTLVSTFLLEHAWKNSLISDTPRQFRCALRPKLRSTIFSSPRRVVDISRSRPKRRYLYREIYRACSARPSPKSFDTGLPVGTVTAASIGTGR